MIGPLLKRCTISHSLSRPGLLSVKSVMWIFSFMKICRFSSVVGYLTRIVIFKLWCVFFKILLRFLIGLAKIGNFNVYLWVKIRRLVGCVKLLLWCLSTQGIF